MRWEVLLVPLIALVVAVLASVFRGAEEAKRRNAQRQGNGPEPRRERPRPDSSGIDQFLEEIRRRQSARQESARTPQREMRKPRPASPAPAEERPTPPVESPRREREVPVLAVAVEVPIVPPIPVVEVPLARPMPAAAPVVSVARPEGTAAAGAVRTHLAAILKTKPGLRAAFVLREIFDAPLSRRRG